MYPHIPSTSHCSLSPSDKGHQNPGVPLRSAVALEPSPETFGNVGCVFDMFYQFIIYQNLSCIIIHVLTWIRAFGLHALCVWTFFVCCGKRGQPHHFQATLHSIAAKNELSVSQHPFCQTNLSIIITLHYTVALYVLLSFTISEFIIDILAPLRCFWHNKHRLVFAATPLGWPRRPPGRRCWRPKRSSSAKCRRRRALWTW